MKRNPIMRTPFEIADRLKMSCSKAEYEKLRDFLGDTHEISFHFVNSKGEEMVITAADSSEDSRPIGESFFSLVARCDFLSQSNGCAESILSAMAKGAEIKEA